MNKKPFFVDVARTKDSVVAWVRDHSGKLEYKEYPIGDYCYCFIPENSTKSTGYVDIYGNPVRRVDFDNSYQLNQYRDAGGVLYESDIPIETKFMIDEFLVADPESPVNVMMYDIEVNFDLDDGLGYPEPKNPYGEINMIQCFDKARQVYVMIMMDTIKNKVRVEDERKEHPVEAYFCSSESQMLVTFADVISDIDVLGGWNTNGFDLPYIMERALKLFDSQTAINMFCRNGFSATRRDFTNDFGDDVWEWSLFGRQHVDMLELYKKFVPSELPNFKLDTVAEIVLGENKVAYETNLGAVYRENPQKFVDYAIHDVRLLKILDEKMDIFNIAIMMARDSFCKIGKVTATVMPVENAFLAFCRNRGNIVLHDKKHTEKNEKFTGAIVYDTITGKHGWSFSVDLTALYPSAIIMLGLSRETALFQMSRRYNDYINVMALRNKSKPIQITDLRTGQISMIDSKKFYQDIKSNGWVVSANGTVFSGEMGVLAAFVKEGFDKRNEFKAAMKTAANDEDAKRFDLKQKVKKIRNNSIYGAIGNAAFREYDLDFAMSITLTGQVISKIQAVRTDQMISEFAA